MLVIVLIVLFSVQLQILIFRVLSVIPRVRRERLLRQGGYLLVGTLFTVFLLFELSFQWPQFSLRLPTYNLWGPS
uniref:Uncharacterized protein n=1 Tax=Leptospirillum ferriphilum TaxID=178606 RepID=A0A7C3LXD8_9BACT